MIIRVNSESAVKTFEEMAKNWSVKGSENGCLASSQHPASNTGFQLKPLLHFALIEKKRWNIMVLVLYDYGC